MVSTLITFYLLVLGGYLLKKIKVFKTEDTAVFVNYIIHFALPIAVFGVIHHFDFSIKDAAVFATAWISILFSTAFIFLVLRPKFADERTLKSFYLSATFGNTAFVGYPVAYTLFGDKGLAYAILYDVVGNFLFVITVGIFLIIGKSDWRLVYKFPPLGALLLAFLLKGIKLGFLKTFIGTVKASITPTIVFALGLRFEPKEALKNLPLASLAVFWRLFLIPSLVLPLLILFKDWLNLPFEEVAVILLQSSMPPFVMAVILSEKYKLNTDLSLAAANLGILLLPLSLPFWFFVAEKLLK